MKDKLLKLANFVKLRTGIFIIAAAVTIIIGPIVDSFEDDSIASGDLPSNGRKHAVYYYVIPVVPSRGNCFINRDVGEFLSEVYVGGKITEGQYEESVNTLKRKGYTEMTILKMNYKASAFSGVEYMDEYGDSHDCVPRCNIAFDYDMSDHEAKYDAMFNIFTNMW